MTVLHRVADRPSVSCPLITLPAISSVSCNVFQSRSNLFRTQFPAARFPAFLPGFRSFWGARADDLSPNVSSQTGQNTGCLLLAGIVIATLTEAIAGTALTLGKGDIIGDVYATPDEFARLDIGYTTLKMIALLTASRIATTVNLRIIVVAATVMITLASAVTALTTRLDLLIVLRAFQGFSGGLLLVIGQTVIFRDFSPSRQPVLQALFATGTVVAPATIVPALQGWLLDSYSWTWIFLSVVPIGLLAAGLVLLSEETSDTHIPYRRFDWSGLLLASITLFCLVYVLSRGDRWNWFDERRVRWLTGIGVVTLCLFVGQQASRPEDEGLLELSVFRSADFTFAFIVSFVAGAALFGSTYLIRVSQSRSGFHANGYRCSFARQ